MEDSHRDPLSILAGLAKEYQQKYDELTDAVRDTQPEQLPLRLETRSELTTKRFREAQQILIASLMQQDCAENTDVYRAALTLCRCFDEMRILFQFLLEHPSKRMSSGDI